MKNLVNKFQRIKARVKFGEIVTPRRADHNAVRLNVARDRKGTFFEVLAGRNVQIEVLEVRPEIRHLLLMAKIPSAKPGLPDEKHKYLLGHDERDWFVAAVPETESVSSVRTAMEALKPAVVQAEQVRKRVKSGASNRRRNSAFSRQGEWFFIARPDLEVDERLVLRNEALRRGRSRPHIAEFLYRTGGTMAYVNHAFPNGISANGYAKLGAEQRRQGMFRPMTRDPLVFVKGRVRHADHRTITLPCWHQVVPNTEAQAAAMRGLAFLD